MKGRTKKRLWRKRKTPVVKKEKEANNEDESILRGRDFETKTRGSEKEQ